MPDGQFFLHSQQTPLKSTSLKDNLAYYYWKYGVAQSPPVSNLEIPIPNEFLDVTTLLSINSNLASKQELHKGEYCKSQ